MGYGSVHVCNSGYPHDSRADKNPYPHDRRVNMDTYPGRDM